jgi:hypothetical protein
MKKVLALALCLFALSAHAQSVRQSGNITPGHVSVWVTQGVIADGGVPGGPIFTGSTTQNDFACAGASSTIIDCGLSATGTNNWTGQQNFNGGATAPTRSLGDSTTNVATTAFVATNSLAVGTTAIGSGTINGLLYDNSGVLGNLATANNGALITSSGGVPSISSTLPAAVQGNITSLGTIGSGVWQGTPVAVGFGGTGLTSGTSGGIPYFNSGTTIASSGAPSAGQIMTWGGAGGAPAGSPCSIVLATLTCASSVSIEPEVALVNNTNDAGSAYLIFLKTRASGNTNSADTLGAILAQGFANSSVQNVAQIAFIQAAASSGANIPTKIVIATSNAAGPLNNTLTFDNNAHIGVFSAAGPSANSCTGFAAAASSIFTDVAGNATMTSGTSCSITFAVAFAGKPACWVMPGSAASTVEVVPSTTGLAITFGTAQTAFGWGCTGS